LKSDELVPCRLGRGEDARARFSAPTFRVNYEPRLRTFAAVVLRKSAAAQWLFGIVSSLFFRLAFKTPLVR
jgi:hypothetical protein